MILSSSKSPSVNFRSIQTRTLTKSAVIWQRFSEADNPVMTNLINLWLKTNRTPSGIPSLNLPNSSVRVEAAFQDLKNFNLKLILATQTLARIMS